MQEHLRLFDKQDGPGAARFLERSQDSEHDCVLKALAHFSGADGEAARNRSRRLASDADPLGAPARRTRSTSAGRLAAVHGRARAGTPRSEEHTSELQSHHDLVCRLLLEKKKQSQKKYLYLKKNKKKNSK